MNIYEKLQTVRVELQGLNLKKTGKNTFAGYDYFELGDFLPHVNDLFLEHRLFSHVTFTDEMATLTVVDMDKPEDRIVFTSPMAEATLKAAHPIQNLGAVETYQRRYLYVAALEITESDALDATQGRDSNKQQARNNGRQQARQAPQQQTQASSNGWQMSEAQRKRLFAIARGAGIDNDGVRSVVMTVSGQESTAKLTREQYDTVCEMLESQGRVSA